MVSAYSTDPSDPGKKSLAFMTNGEGNGGGSSNGKSSSNGVAAIKEDVALDMENK